MITRIEIHIFLNSSTRKKANPLEQFNPLGGDLPYVKEGDARRKFQKLPSDEQTPALFSGLELFSPLRGSNFKTTDFFCHIIFSSLIP